MLALHRVLTADGWVPFDDVSGLPAALEQADADARAAGTEQPDSTNFAGAGYRSDDGRFMLQLGFRSFDIYTGRPAPALGLDAASTR